MEQFDEATLKRVLKEALAEVLEEKRELFMEMLAEVVEDFAVALAVDEIADVRAAAPAHEVFTTPDAQA